MKIVIGVLLLCFSGSDPCDPNPCKHGKCIKKFTFTKYGDFLKLKPSGAKARTARQDGLAVTGVAASQALVARDIKDLDRLKEKCYKVGQKLSIHPALIAALASRESRGGRLLIATKGWGDKKNGKFQAYGILQCDIKTSGLGKRCTAHKWDSLEHLEMMIKEVFIHKISCVQKKHPTWSKERQLQGAVAAYNFGVRNVQTWERLDVGTTNDDYSNDVIARAQHLVNKFGWK